MKVESLAIVFLTLCIFLSFYFSFLSFQSMDENLKKQLVTLATYSIITGVIIMACLMVHLGIKRAFFSIESRLKGAKEPLENDRDEG